MREFCPVCESETSYIPDVKKSIINCPRCGKFYYSGLLDENLYLENKEKVLISGFLRDNPGFFIKQDNLNQLKNNILMPTPSDKIDRIMLAFGELTETPGDMINTSKNASEYLEVIGKSYISNFNEWKFLVYRTLADEKDFIQVISITSIIIKSSGWEYIEFLRNNVNQNTNDRGNEFIESINTIIEQRNHEK